MAHTIGIDIGGTNTRVALIDDCHQLLQRIQLPTDTTDPEQEIRLIKEAIDVMSPYDIIGIGISCPGPLDSKAGQIIFTPNLENAWYGFPLTETLSKYYGYPVCLENDANLAALAEAVVGAGQFNQYVHYLTISTGIGSGFVINKHIYQGAHGFAGEVANTCMWQDGPENPPICAGGIEAISSGTAITQRARHLGLDVSHAGEVAQLDFDGNPIAHAIMEESKNHLANFIGCIYALEDPDIIVLGGSVALKIPNFISDIEMRVQQKALPVTSPHIRILPAILGEDSGLIGAAYYARQFSEQTKGYQTTS